MSGTEPVRWGILGTSRNASKRLIPAMQNSDSSEVYAIASRDLKRAKAFAKVNKIPRAYGSYEELLADPDVDAVYNPTPNALHEKTSLMAADAGKPVLVEKPLATNTIEAQRMVSNFEAAGLLFAEALMYRHHPQTQMVQEIIRRGTIGEVRTITTSFCYNIEREDSNVRLRKDLAGGALRDVGMYCVNLIRMVAGEEPSGATARAIFGSQSDVDETVVGLLSFPGGVLGHFECSFRAHYSNYYEIRGSEGSINVERGYSMRPDEPGRIQVWRGGDYREFTTDPADHYQLMVEDFVDALRTGRAPLIPPADGVANMRVLDRLLSSVWG